MCMRLSVHSQYKKKSVDNAFHRIECVNFNSEPREPCSAPLHHPRSEQTSTHTPPRALVAVLWNEGANPEPDARMRTAALFCSWGPGLPHFTVHGFWKGN